jgi:hypothetical protein
VEWWIAGGVVVLAVVFLLVVLGLLAGRLRRFAGAATTLQTRLTDGQQRFEPRVAAIQRQAAALQEKVLVTQERAERLRQDRQDPDNS